MAKRPPAKGSTNWHPLPNAPDGFDGVEVGIKFVGARAARDWSLRAQKIALEEIARNVGASAAGEIALLRSALSKIAAGAVDPCEVAHDALGADKPQSYEYAKAIELLAVDALKECVSGIRGVDDLQENDVDGALDLLEDLGEEVEVGVFNLARSQQSLSLRQKFHSTPSGG